MRISATDPALLAIVLTERHNDAEREYARAAKADDTQLQAYYNGKMEALAGMLAYLDHDARERGAA